ncbi:phosphoenolpyruvate carboxykinase (ATP) [Parerythrobacter jejuensis]|uniref:Hpr(Ser) kinase/phosphatase n=1 Tax=Parerythrobacter jejuensis TaxID=795812 RepID=A0A845AQV2_9SPHN|nr:hypothetical protein [Parerythrobacter jejuensis]MXP31777.1 hypothetical protein [Parerythrobacter jejuensis]
MDRVNTRQADTKLPQFSYRHSGCVIRSDLELPEWQCFAEDHAPDPAEIEIRFDCNLSGDAPPAQHPSATRDSLRFTIDQVGTWRIDAGGEIALQPFDGHDPAALRLFTLGSAWGALGYQRGWPMVHGSAVLAAKGAALFCGPQEAGKSTMAAALVESGLPLVSDDLSRAKVDEQAGGAVLYPSSSRIKLWQPAIDHLEWGTREMVRDHAREEKFHLSADRHVGSAEPVPLAAIYALEFGDELSIERVTGADAAALVLKGTMYRKQFLHAMGRLPEQAVHAAQIAASTPVYRLTRPRDLMQLHTVSQAVSDHLSG